jgi:zinc protease
MTASLLDEGAGDLGADAFKEALESKAIRFTARADRDYIVVSLATLKDNADEAVRLAALALGHPRFDAPALERVRAELAARLKQEEQNPTRVAVKSWFASWFGQHPYGHPPQGTATGLAAITPADLKSFAESHFVRGGIKLAAAGDITEAALKRYLQQLFLALPANAVAPPPRVTESGKAGTRTMLRSEAAPVAVFGMAAPMRSDADFIPVYVANQIIGGGTFNARLMDEVRDKRGLTYGIETHIEDFRSASVLIGEVQSDKAKITTALEVTKSELAKFAHDGVTAKELADAKTYLTGSYPLTLDSNAKIARTLGSYQRSGLSPDYVTRRNAMIAGVTLEKVNQAAKKYFDPSRLLVVVVGTPAVAANAAPGTAR